MKRFLLLFLLTAISFTSVRAQLPDGSTAPDWILTDLNGNVHHLQDYLDEGKTVFIDMFATWCGPCWNYHQTHALKDLYEEYGPDGTGQVMVFGIEADMSTPTNCIYDIDCPSSQGDWTAGVPYPIIDLTPTNGPTMAINYNLAYYPTIYGICPNGQVWEVGQKPVSALVGFMNNCPQPPPLAVSYTTTDIKCTLAPVGAINLSPQGGKSPYTYTWSNGATTKDINNIPTGTYSCTVTDAKGDQVSTGPISITGPTSLIAIESQTAEPATCEQSNGSLSVVVTGGDPGYTYTWNNGATTPTLSGVFAGTYSVNVVDSKGCSISASIDVVNIPSPTVLVSDGGQQLSCSNPTVTINSNGSSTGPEYTYSWTTSNGSILSDPLLTEITVGSPGLYVLTIFNTELGCYNANFIQINGASGLPIANAGNNDVLPCSGGEVTLSGSASSTGANFSYEWTTSNGNIVSDPGNIEIEVDAPGTYILHVTNTSNGCTATDEVIVEVDNTVNYTSSVSQIKCNGAADGTITIDQTNYSYSWSNGATSNSITGLSIGTYEVTITNSAGCTSTQSFTISQPAVLTAAFTGTDTEDATSNDGTATAAPSGGTAPYNYIWSNGATTATITGLAPGSYSVTITDANGCTTTGSYAINVQGCTLGAQASVSDAACYGAASGTITLDLSNVTGNADITWNTGATTPTLENVAAGSYSAVIQDEAGCLTVVNVVVSQPEEIILGTVESVKPLCPQDNTGSIVVTAEGGAGTFSYEWSNGQTGSSITDLTAGVYSVEISDGTGCSTVKDIILNSQDTEKPDLRLKTTELLIGQDGVAEVIFDLINDGSSDNCSGYTVSMVPEEFTCDQTGIQTIEVTLTDASGNKTTKTVDVSVVDKTAPVWDNCPSGEYLASSCNGLAGLDLTYSDNCSDVQLQQIKGIDIQVEFPIGNTVQEYVLVDEAGNSSTCSFTVHRDPELQINTTFQNASCNKLGNIEVTTEGGSAPMAYTWEDGSTSNKNEVQPGTYHVVVTDASGCSKEVTVTIGGPYVYDVENADIVVPGAGSSDGSIDITLNGPSDGLTFSWTKDGEAFATTEDLANLESGVYELKISDANGCIFGPYTYNITPSGYDAGLESRINVYPNPVRDILTIQYEGQESEMMIQVIDALGRRVDLSKVNLTDGKAQLSTRSLSNGTYRMIIDNGSRVTVKQFVVIK